MEIVSPSQLSPAVIQITSRYVSATLGTMAGVELADVMRTCSAMERVEFCFAAHKSLVGSALRDVPRANGTRSLHKHRAADLGIIRPPHHDTICVKSKRYQDFVLLVACPDPRPLSRKERGEEMQHARTRIDRPGGANGAGACRTRRRRSRLSFDGAHRAACGR